MTVVTSPPDAVPRQSLDPESEPDALATLLAEQPGVARTLTQLVDEARRSTFCDAAAIELTTDGRTVATAASEDSVAVVDGSQQEYAEGPGLQSLRTRSDFMSSDTRVDGRWPRWGARTAELGWLSVVSKQLGISSQTRGTLNLYARRSDAFSTADLEVAEFFARYASAALSSAHQRDALLAASKTRHAIGVAEGILMQRYELDPEAAFTSLRRRGRDNHTTLLATAEAVVSDQSG